MLNRISIPIVVAGFGLACAAADAREAERNLVRIEALDYAYVLPASVPAGYTTLRMVNRGPELHHAQLIRLTDGKTLADLLSGMSGHALPSWAVPLGGPNAVVPSDSSEIDVQLDAGRYALVCWIPSPDGIPHVMKGMATEFMVEPSDSEVAEPATADVDVTLRLNDYVFGWSGPLQPGRRTIRVINDAHQWHEVLFAQLAPGKTAHDLVAWIEGGEQGPPPGKPLGGTVGIASRGENIVRLDVVPGRYALLCFLPDHQDGLPHVAHGMIAEIEVPGDAGGAQ